MIGPRQLSRKTLAVLQALVLEVRLQCQARLVVEEQTAAALPKPKPIATPQLLAIQRLEGPGGADRNWVAY